VVLVRLVMMTGAQDYTTRTGACSQRRYLTKVFRFGRNIAHVANSILQLLKPSKPERRRLLGNQRLQASEGVVVVAVVVSLRFSGKRCGGRRDGPSITNVSCMFV